MAQKGLLGDAVEATRKIGLNFKGSELQKLNQAEIPDRKMLHAIHSEYRVIAAPRINIASILELCENRDLAYDFIPGEHPFHLEPLPCGFYVVSRKLFSVQDEMPDEGLKKIHPAIPFLVMLIHHREKGEWFWGDHVYIGTNGFFSNGKMVYLGVDNHKIRAMEHKTASCHTVGGICVQRLNR